MLAKVLTNFQSTNQADREGMGTAGGSLGPVWYDIYSLLSVMMWYVSK